MNRNIDIKGDSLDYVTINAYSGYYLDSKRLKQSASGGGCSVIAESIILKGGMVFGVSYTEDFKGAVYCCANNISELEKLKGSKYIESSKKVFDGKNYRNVFLVVGERLQEGKIILFIGLGCDIAALNNYIESKDINNKNLYTVELICQGPTVTKVGRDYIDYIEKKYRANVVDFSVRYKKEGWIPPYIHAEFDNGKTHEERFYESDYGYAFSIYSKKNCYKCRFKGNNHQADVVVGDYWGIDNQDPNYNKDGVSVLFTRTSKGELLLSWIDQSIFCIHKADIDKAITYNPRYLTPNTMNVKWEAFDQNIKRYTLHKAIIKTDGYVRYIARKTHVLTLLNKILPCSIVSLIKR